MCVDQMRMNWRAHRRIEVRTMSMDGAQYCNCRCKSAKKFVDLWQERNATRGATPSLAARLWLAIVSSCSPLLLKVLRSIMMRCGDATNHDRHEAATAQYSSRRSDLVSRMLESMSICCN
ncbi:hypothetical protein MRB53_037865 [Persea americana]|nr:hypothetical protein MRB53_037865 [Persea americana]